MIKLKFKCELLSDVILNKKSASIGPNSTLDFISGNTFLGIVAGKCYSKGTPEMAIELFHSGKVRFGDAHPSNGAFRSLRVPASMLYPKLKSASEVCYIHHLTDLDSHKNEQLKQCRDGFYDFSNVDAQRIAVEKNFAIKSAYDYDIRRSSDGQMYGYQSLNKGLTLFFDIEVENETFAKTISDALCGVHHIGRSKTAQYGLVGISKCEYCEVESAKSDKLVTVYADGRLIFMDNYGQPTFQPTPEQLDLPVGTKILWNKSQIRTFQYSPWNSKRQCFDADRCGIEKGSVIVAELSDGVFDSKSHYVGLYNNEGFGKVIYNPSFLQAASDGSALYRLHDVVSKEPNRSNVKLDGTPLLRYLAVQKRNETILFDVYNDVNEFVSRYASKFKGEEFASQWGTIRSIATQNKTKQSIIDEIRLFLTHGVAADKWSERGRIDLLMNFIDKLNDADARIAIINLAAEMAKKCRNNG